VNLDKWLTLISYRLKFSDSVQLAKAMLLTSNRGFAERGEVFGGAVVAIPASPPRYRHPKLFRYVQNYSLDLRGVNLAN
jgi:hypothetical protein